MTEIRIEATGSKQKLKPETTAAELLERCRLFFRDPENEREFQEWKAGKGKKNDLVRVG